MLAQLASPPVTVGSVQLCYLHTDSPKFLCSAINPIERLVEHVFVVFSCSGFDPEVPPLADAAIDSLIMFRTSYSIGGW